MTAGVLLGLVWVALNWSSYNATARVILRDPWDADLATTDNPVGGDFERFIRAQSRYMTSDEILSIAATEAAIDQTTLKAATTAAPGAEGDLVLLTVTADSAAAAETWRDAILDAYSGQRRALVQEQAQQALDAIAAQQQDPVAAFDADLAQQASELEIAVSSYADGINFVARDPAASGLSAVTKLAYPILGGLAGLAGGLVAAWLLADRRPKLIEPSDLVGRYGMVHLGTVPQIGSEVPGDAVSRAAFEITMLALANQLRTFDPRSGGKAYGVVLTSAETGAGVTATARMLAQSALDNGARAEVIDADARRRPGGIDGRVVDRALHDHGVVLFDCAPPQLDSTALRLGMDLDAVVLVLRKGCDLRTVDEAVRLFETVGVEPAGFIVTLPSRDVRRRSQNALTRGAGGR